MKSREPIKRYIRSRVLTDPIFKRVMDMHISQYIEQLRKLNLPLPNYSILVNKVLDDGLVYILYDLLKVKCDINTELYTTIHSIYMNHGPSLGNLPDKTTFEESFLEGRNDD